MNIKRANLHKIHKQDAVLYSSQCCGVGFSDCSDNSDVCYTCVRFIFGLS